MQLVNTTIPPMFAHNRSFLTTLLLFFFWSCLLANNIKVVKVEPSLYFTELTIEVTWENSWQIAGSGAQDQAWVFVKYKNRSSSQWQHLKLDTITSITSTVGALGASVSSSSDGAGIRIPHVWPYADTFGFAQVEFVVQIDPSVNLDHPSFKAFAIEMVRPSSSGGTIQLGDAVSHNRFHAGNDSLAPFDWTGVFDITVSNAAGGLATTSNDLESGSFDRFEYPILKVVAMKHEISQQQYVQFLNCLTRAQQNSRTETDLEDAGNTNPFVMSDSPTVEFRNGISRDPAHGGGPYEFFMDLNGNGVPNEVDDGQNIACNYLSGEDLQAYLDWAGLRPMSEFEYEYLCRKREPPVPGEYAWGTTQTNYASMVPATEGRPGERAIQAGSNGLLRLSQFGPMRTGFAANDTTNRIQAGAGEFGALDLSGNVAEMVVSVALDADRDFHFQDIGDGTLTILGSANEPTWPSNMTIRGRAATTDVWTVSRRGTQLVTGRSPHNGGRGVLPSF